MLIRTPNLRALPGIPRNCSTGDIGLDEPSRTPGTADGSPDRPSISTDTHMALATPTGTRGAVDAADFVRTAVFRLDPVPESAGRARRAARTMLTDWRLGHLVEDVDLVVSELVTNALLHGGGDGPAGAAAAIRLELQLSGGRLTCRVVDPSPLPPAPEEATETAESGRGLILVEALAAAWGWQELPDGKAVWASFGR
jgi:anti-sigma regulatory factor (Ser/Thr protein kinase)